MRMAFSSRDAVMVSLLLLICIAAVSCSRRSLLQTTPQTIHQLLKLDASGCLCNHPEEPLFSPASDEPMPVVTQTQVTPDPVMVKAMHEARLQLQQPSRYVGKLTTTPPGIVLANGNMLYVEDNLYGLKKPDGTVVIAPAFSYITPAFIYTRADQMKGFAACAGTACNYYDADGKKALPMDYAGVQPTAAGTFIIYTHEGVGVIDATGQMLVAPSFYDITTLYEWSSRTTVFGRDGQAAAAPTTLNINFETDKSHFFYRVYTHPGRSFLLRGDAGDTLWLPTNTNPRYVYDDPWFASANYLMIDNMLVNVKTKRKLICEPGYEARVVDAVHQLAAIVAPDGLEYLVHFDGTLVTSTAFHDISNFDTYEGNETSPTPASIVQGSMPHPGSGIDPTTIAGAIDRNGQWVVPPQYSSMYVAGPGVLAAQSGGMIGLFDAAGNKLTQFKYTETSQFGDGLILAAFDAGEAVKADIIRASDGEVLQHGLPYSEIKAVEFCSGTYYIASGPEGETVLNETFVPVLPGFYDYVFETLQNGSIKVGLSFGNRRSRFQLFDCNGKVRTIKVQGREHDSFSWIANPDAHLTHVVLTDSTAWFVLPDGSSVPGDARIRAMQADYRDLYIIDIATPLGEGEGILIDHGIVNTGGQTIVPPIFETIEPFSTETGLAFFYYDDYHSESGVRSGYFTPEGDVLFNMQYEATVYIEGGLFKVLKNHHWGVVTRANKLIIPMVYDEIDLDKSLFLLEAQRGETIDRFTPQGTKLK